jgi:hypothetical protein
MESTSLYTDINIPFFALKYKKVNEKSGKEFHGILTPGFTCVRNMDGRCGICQEV